MVCVMYFGSPDVTIYNVFICNITRKHLSLRNFYIYSSKYTHYSVNHVSRLVPWRKINLNTQWIFFSFGIRFQKKFFQSDLLSQTPWICIIYGILSESFLISCLIAIHISKSNFQHHSQSNLSLPSPKWTFRI